MGKLLVGNKCELTVEKVVDYEIAKVSTREVLKGKLIYLIY